MEKRMCYYLKRMAPHNGHNVILPFKTDKVLIGRSAEATHVIPHQLISRKHASFRRFGERWTINNLSLNGVFLNGDSLIREEEYDIEVGDTVQFGQPAQFIYCFGMKEISARPGSSSQQHNMTTESEGSNSSLQTNLNQEHAVLEQQLKESDALQIRLQQERNELRMSLHLQKNQLEEKYQRKKERLEQQFAAGSLAQQVMLQETETLAERLEKQVSELQGRLEEERNTVEERLRKEEEQRNRILQEKENVLHRLEEEKAKLELTLQEERQSLQEQLKATETHRENLQKEVEAKESAIRVKEAEQQQAEEERQKLKDELAQERLRLVEELESVKSALAEKELTNALLGSELKGKEDELQSKLLSLENGMKAKVTEEVEKSAALLREETSKQLEQVLQDKSRLEEQLLHAQAQDQEELCNLQEALQVVEAQKISLEQELQSTAVATKHARMEIVESVSDVLENEFQCPICNELFITAITLSCSHTFCRYCIDQWKKNKRDCPSCRQPISSETRSLVIDNFIEKLIPTLSGDMKKRRAEIVKERKAEMEAAALAQAQAEAAAAATRRGRRGRGRGNQGRRGRGGHVYASNVPGSRLPHPPLMVGVHSRGQFIQATGVRMTLPNNTVVPQRVLITPLQVLPVSSAFHETGSSTDNRAEATQGSANNPIYIRDQNTPITRIHHSGTSQDPAVLCANEQLSTYSSRQRQERSQTGPNRTRGNEHQAAAHAENPQPQTFGDLLQYVGINYQTSASYTDEIGNSELITVSSNSETTDASMNSDSSSVSGEETEYYPGYGRCFNCGRRGHWANGCPERWY